MLMEMSVALITGIFAIVISLYLFYHIKAMPSGNEKMISIADAIHKGAMAYLKTQTKYVSIFAIVIFIVFVLIGFMYDMMWIGIAISFLVGAVASTAAGYIGMLVTTMANVRTAESAKNGLNAALNVSFKAGNVMGFAVVGIGLVALIMLIFIFDMGITSGFFGAAAQADSLGTLMRMLAGIGFGASLVAMFGRVGGGIFTKGADVGADLVGKVEAGIPEDDPRNPAVIADNVGDNVGDCAGMGADLFESYVVTIVATMILGVLSLGIVGVTFPLYIAAFAIIATLIGGFFVKTKEGGDPLKALITGILVTAILCAIGFYVIIGMLLPVNIQMGVFISSLIGLIVGILVLFITDYYTGDHRPVHSIAQAATTGAGTNIITGLAVGLESTLPFALVIIAAIALSFHFGGIYGIAVATLALLSLTGIIVAVDTFGPVSDNAGGIVEMSELPEEYRTVTDKLDMVGNTTKATTKGFAIASAGLAVLVLILAFTSEANMASVALGLGEICPVDTIGLPIISMVRPAVLLGLMVGAVLPFIFSAYAMRAVGIAAMKIVEEVRRQFKTLKIMEGKDKPDYEKCVEISTQAAIGELLKIGALVVITPLLVGFLFGVHAITGLLMGSLLTGMLMAVFMSNTGGAWDNAKKYIESGHHGGKKSDAHKAAVVGDTVGDPLKDTAGPALNPMIKILNTMSIILAVLFVAYSLNLLG